MRAYWVTYKHTDWGIVVVTTTARRARNLVDANLPSDLASDLPFLDLRATWLRGMVPPTDHEGFVYACKASTRWTCAAWG